MAQAYQHERIRALDHSFTVDLVTQDGRCQGVVVLDELTGSGP